MLTELGMGMDLLKGYKIMWRNKAALLEVENCKNLVIKNGAVFADLVSHHDQVLQGSVFLGTFGFDGGCGLGALQTLLKKHS